MQRSGADAIRSLSWNPDGELHLIDREQVVGRLLAADANLDGELTRLLSCLHPPTAA